MTIVISWSWFSFFAGFVAFFVLGFVLLAVIAVKQSAKKKVSANASEIDRWVARLK